MKTKRFFIVVLILFSAILLACNSEEEKVRSDKIPVKTTKVEYQKISIPIITSGRILSSSETKLSFKTGGIVNKIYVKEGQKVAKGELLASLDLSEIEAQVKNARNGLLKAERDFERVKNLFTDSVATLEQYQNAETAFDVAKSNLEIAEFNYKYSKITAPADGKILKKIPEEDELVGPGSPIFLFGTTSKNWRILVGVTDKDIVKIKLGDSASVMLDAYPNEKLNALVTEVGQSANPMNGTYEVELSVRSDKLNIISGFIAKVEIYPSIKKGCYIIPSSALVEADGTDGYVFQLTDNREGVVKTPIQILEILNESIAVQSEEKLNEIVTDGSVYLNAGSKVSVIN